MLNKGDSRLTSVNGAHWVTAQAIPVKATSAVAPEVFVMKLEAESLSLSIESHNQGGLTMY